MHQPKHPASFPGMMSQSDIGVSTESILWKGNLACLAAWNIALHEKISVAQLVKKLLAFYEEPEGSFDT
jgi:hypothetical protein